MKERVETKNNILSFQLYSLYTKENSLYVERRCYFVELWNRQLIRSCLSCTHCWDVVSWRGQVKSITVTSRQPKYLRLIKETKNSYFWIE